jgi:hypothetical protein
VDDNERLTSPRRFFVAAVRLAAVAAEIFDLDPSVRRSVKYPYRRAMRLARELAREVALVESHVNRLAEIAAEARRNSPPRKPRKKRPD